LHPSRIATTSTTNNAFVFMLNTFGRLLFYSAKVIIVMYFFAYLPYYVFLCIMEKAIISMNAPTHLPADYMDSLLQLSDEKKLRVIHVLIDSLAKPVRSTKRKNASKKTMVKESFPEDVQSLIGIASDINIVDSDDDRLKYLLNK
jgi:hypothetical protein